MQKLLAEQSPPSEEDSTELAMPLFIDIGCNTDTQLPVSVSVQTEKTETVNRYTQTERKKKSVHKAIQTDSQMHPLCIHRVPDQANEGKI